MRVLVVDNNESFLKLFQFYASMELKGVDCLFTTSGEESLTMLNEFMISEEPISLVVCDVRMNRMSGIETLKQIRTQYPSLPVILISALLTEELIEEAQLNGATAIIDKDEGIQGINDEIIKILSIKNI